MVKPENNAKSAVKSGFLLCYNEIMAVIAPNSEIYLIKCPIELDNLNQLSFANATAQHNYFNSLPKLALTNATFQRKDGTIRWPGSMESILEYNYCMYRNKSHGNKWFYAFITNIEYINDNMSAITIKTDVWQTWQFDLTFNKCFVEREHVNNDTFGLHTLEENIPSGEWMINATQELEITNPKTCFVVVLLTELIGNLLSTYGSRLRVYNGIPSGCYFLFLDVDTTYTSLNNLIEAYDSVGKAEAIMAMYLVPKSLMGTEGTDYNEYSIDIFTGQYGIDCFVPKASTGVKLVSTSTITRNSTLNGYSPKNNKCFTKQFNYIMVMNNAGESAIYNWEDFNGNPQFKLFATYQQGTPTKLVPINYRGGDEPAGNAYSLSGAPFPIVSWQSDYYLNWQAKNGWTGFSQRAKDYVDATDISNLQNIRSIEDVGSMFGNALEKVLII